MEMCLARRSGIGSVLGRRAYHIASGGLPMLRKFRPLLVAVSLVALGVGGSVNASAYGTEHVFQITLSENCVNPTLCVAGPTNPFGIGGIWGWVEPDADGTAEAQVQFQGHSNADPSLNGSGHLPTVWNWQI